MRKWILLILALLPVCGVWSQVVFKNDEVTVSLLKDKTWVFETWDYTTMYLLEGTGRAALIDAGTRCADLDQIVERITDKPYDVIITHAHPDHAGCIGYFDEVWMHRNDSVLIAERTKDYKGTVRDGGFRWANPFYSRSMGSNASAEDATAESSRIEALEVLKTVGIADQSAKRPSQLSGGQRQRVAIARALIRKPGIVLADEPTASLDQKSGREIVEIIKKMAKELGVTVVLVTHDNRILDIADRIVSLVDGKLVSF